MANNQFFDNMDKKLNKAEEDIKQRLKAKYMRAVSGRLQEEKGTTVEPTKDGFKVKVDTSTEGPIDMKPFFRRSAKKQRTEKGGWHLTIPIRMYTPGSKTASHSNRMSTRLYGDLKSKAKSGDRVLVSDYLYDHRQVSPIEELNYKPKGNNIDRLDNKKGRGSIYVAFRRVSDKSAPNSWIINRGQATDDNLTPDIRNIINQVRGGRG